MSAKIKNAALLILWILFLAVVTGLTIDFVIYNIIEIERTNSRFEMIGFALLYTLVFMGFDHLTNFVLARLTNGLTSWRSVLYHILIHSSSWILAFFVATLTLDTFNVMKFGSFMLLDAANPVLYVIALVSFAAALFGTSLYYGTTYFQKLKDAEKAALEAQFSALKAQVNPHFLFNALNSITSLIRTQPLKAEEVTQDLADLFRYSLNSSKADLVTLAQECDAVMQYMNIEKARFGDRLEFSCICPEHLSNALIPGFVIQPLAENAVKHGVAKSMTSCTIVIEISQKDDKLIIQVSDNGPGFSGKHLTEFMNQGTGLKNIADRLNLLYHNEASFTLGKDGPVIALPYQTLKS